MSLPYFPMYPTDFEAKTSHLTLEEDGAYNRLLRLCWMSPDCSLPDDNAWILRRMRVDKDTFERVVLVVLNEFFVRSNGRLSNARLAREFATSNAAHSKRVSAGKKGGDAKALKTLAAAPSNAVAKPYQPEPEPEPEYTVAKATDADGVDPTKQLFDLGIKVLGSCGVVETRARQMVGKWRKDHPSQDGQILSAIMECRKEGAVDPVPWITAKLTPPPRKSVHLWTLDPAKLNADGSQK